MKWLLFFFSHWLLPVFAPLFLFFLFFFLIQKERFGSSGLWVEPPVRNRVRADVACPVDDRWQRRLFWRMQIISARGLDAPEVDRHMEARPTSNRLVFHWVQEIGRQYTYLWYHFSWLVTVYGRSGAWSFQRRWRRVRDFLKLWEARVDAEYGQENWVFLSLRPETDLCNQFGEKIKILWWEGIGLMWCRSEKIGMACESFRALIPCRKS